MSDQVKTPNVPAVGNSSVSQQIEQQIQIFKSKLQVPKRSNIKSGGKLGRSTEINVNYLPLNLEKLYKKTLYHIDVTFNPELPKKLLR